jgi:hypothetical protein
VAELVRVDDRAHALDLALRDVEAHHADQLAVAVEDQRTRLPVHVLAADVEAEAAAGAQPRHQRARDLGAAVDRMSEGGRLAAAVAVEHHIVGQQLLQPLEIALLRGREEPGRKRLPLLARGLEPGAPLLHVAAGPRGELAGVLLGRPDDLRDPVVGLVEHLAQQERRALLGRQALEHDEEGDRQRVRQLGMVGRVAAALVVDQRLGQPFAEVALALDPGRSQLVDAQPGDHGREIRAWRLDPLALLQRQVQTQQRLLHDVLRLAHAAQHPVGHPERPGPKLLQALRFRHGFSRALR